MAGVNERTAPPPRDGNGFEGRDRMLGGRFRLAWCLPVEALAVGVNN